MADAAVKTTKINVPLLDLKAQYATIREEVRQAVDAVLESQYFILGPAVTAVRATAGPLLRLRARRGGFLRQRRPADLPDGRRDRARATRSSPRRTRSSPPWGPSPASAPRRSSSTSARKPTTSTRRRSRAASPPRTKAIIPVHLYGQCADMDPILEVARRHKLVVIEDAAQAIGAEYKGRRAGSMGEYGCFSFFPSKNLGAAGDGGLVTDAGCRSGRKSSACCACTARSRNTIIRLIGGNFRLDALQAAVISVKFRHLEQWTAGAAGQRRSLPPAVRRGRPGRRRGRSSPPRSPTAATSTTSSSSACRARDELQAYLKEQGVTTEIYYPVPLHLQQVFRLRGTSGAGDFPAERSGGRSRPSPCRSIRSCPTSRRSTWSPLHRPVL